MIIKKKELAAKALKVGKGRIKFVNARLDEIKEAITKQDIKDLVLSGSIIINPIKGRRKNIKRKNRPKMLTKLSDQQCCSLLRK